MERYNQGRHGEKGKEIKTKMQIELNSPQGEDQHKTLHLLARQS